MSSTNDPHPDNDVETDPAHDTEQDEGWASEGGATPSGPATATGDGEDSRQD